jgi:hypothetical protein
MRWISTAAQSECQGQETGGRTVLRANPEGAMGISSSVTDTSIPSADGSRRCALPDYLSVIMVARPGKINLSCMLCFWHGIRQGTHRSHSNQWHMSANQVMSAGSTSSAAIVHCQIHCKRICMLLLGSAIAEAWHARVLLCRTVQSRHRRAKARELHTALSGPLHHTSSEDERDDDEADEVSDLNDASPEARCHC